VPEIAARPYAYAFEVPSTALVVIDMQRDFIERGGFGEALGNDVSRLAAIVPTVAALIEWCRARGIRVLHTREGHRPDLADCDSNIGGAGDCECRVSRDGQASARPANQRREDLLKRAMARRPGAAVGAVHPSSAAN
jgi:nicotinamidase-related amidase